MWKVSLLLVFAFVASSQAVWLYTANAYNLGYSLYAIDTNSYAVYTIGTVMDAQGDKFTIGSMYYDNTTGLLYATANSRGTNPLKRNGLLAINPLTAQVVWSTNCSTAPNPRFTSITYDAPRDRFLLGGSSTYGSTEIYYLSAANLRAGNCSAAQSAWPGQTLGDSVNALEYIPTMDSLARIVYMDDTSNSFTLINASSQTFSSAAVNSTNWWYNRYASGDFYWQPNGTLWATSHSWGPGVSILYQVNIGSNATAIQEGNPIQGFGIRTVIPHAVAALSDGPAPTTFNKWRTGFTGVIAFVTPDNDLFEVNIDVAGIRNVTRLPSKVLAMESMGSWNQIYAIVNTTTASALVHVNIADGSLTTIAQLPLRFQSLTLGADGKLLAMSRLETDGNVTLVQVLPNGTVSEVARYVCQDAECVKAWSDGSFYYFLRTAGYDGANSQNISLSTYSGVGTMGFLSDCPDDNAVEGQYGCGSFDYTSHSYDAITDLSYYPTPRTALASVSYNQGFTTLYRYNTTSNKALPVIDFHHVVADMAYFQYDAAWCNNRGSWAGDACVCNYGVIGTRCETVLPAPVAPPVDPPMAPPVAAPVASPVAAPSLAPRGAPNGAAAAPKISSATMSFVSMSLISMAIVLSLALFTL